MKRTNGTWEPERTGSTNESDMNSGRNTHKFIIKSDEPMNRRYGNKIANILGNESDAKANAHLIASAPEMFQALQKTLSVVGHRDSGVAKKTVKELIDLIAPVLAKAEGGE